MPSLETVYSLRIRIALRREYGIEPIMEKDTPYKPGLKCWTYEATEEFVKALDQIMSGMGYVKGARRRYGRD